MATISPCAVGSFSCLPRLRPLTITLRSLPLVGPMDRKAPAAPGFLQQFQARAGWWSPDGRWFAFESNRGCSNLSGATYSIFIQDAAGLIPAMQPRAATGM